MHLYKDISRRQFIASTSVAMLATQLPALESDKASPASPDAGKLALHGGEKAVKSAPKRPIRWGDPELEQFRQMLK